MKQISFAILALLPSVAAAQTNCTFGCPAPTTTSGFSSVLPTSTPAGSAGSMIDITNMGASAMAAYVMSLQPAKSQQQTQAWLDQYYRNIVLNFPGAPAPNAPLSVNNQGTTANDTVTTAIAGQFASTTAPTMLPASDQSVVALNDATASVPAAAAVPEPASWAMMILGLALMGFALRRRAGEQRALATTTIGH